MGGVWGGSWYGVRGGGVVGQGAGGRGCEAQARGVVGKPKAAGFVSGKGGNKSQAPNAGGKSQRPSAPRA